MAPSMHRVSVAACSMHHPCMHHVSAPEELGHVRQLQPGHQADQLVQVVREAGACHELVLPGAPLRLGFGLQHGGGEGKEGDEAGTPAMSWCCRKRLCALALAYRGRVQGKRGDKAPSCLGSAAPPAEAKEPK